MYPLTLDASKVPPKFRFMILLAEKWGNQDHVYHNNMLENEPVEELRKLVTTVMANHEALDEWLAGPEADMRPPTQEYVAFSCLRIIADMAEVQLTERNIAYNDKDER